MRPGRILFHRDFRQYTGGHGKVWDYFNHALALGWDARVYLTPDSRRDESNPWMRLPERIVDQWQPQMASALFLAGMDWQAVPANAELPPVINLISHVRHADHDPALPLRDFLPRKALRICLSEPIAEAILATGEVNGRVEVIPAALDLPAEVNPWPENARHGVFIVATKQQLLGQALADALQAAGVSVDLLRTDVPRMDYYRRMAQARAVVCLPHAREGFYLPGLEAMGLATPLVGPDCVGNRQYARHDENCLMPALQLPDLLQCTLRLLQDEPLARRLVAAGCNTAEQYGQMKERAAFGRLLEEFFH